MTKYIVVNDDDAADAIEVQLWGVYYAQRLAELGRQPGDSIDSHAVDGSPAPAITTRYAEALRTPGGGPAAFALDEYTRDKLSVKPGDELAADALPESLIAIATPAVGPG